MTLRIAKTGLAVALFALPALVPAAAEPVGLEKHHALSLVGQPQFPADFKHFDWVNPDAPRGGILRQAALGGFDSLNGFTIKGNPAGGLGLLYDTLMASSPDEPSAEYGLIAEWVSYPPDYSAATFKLRDIARFNDGTQIMPEDVIFSLDALKAVSPRYAFYYKNVVKAEKTGEREVTFIFDTKGNRELPQIVGQIPVLPKHFWEAKGANGEPRDLARSSLEIPLGSGPYRVKSVDANRAISFERVADYWAKDLPVMVGQNNFDEIRFLYFRDLVPAFEAFKSGQIDIWQESRASAWATQYSFDAVNKGLIRKETLPHKRVAPMQAFAFNTRRSQFQDPRVRQAFNYAFNFEEANRTLFYGSYIRVGSYFDNSELKATGLPQGRELEILDEVRSEVPAEVFTTEWKNPVNVEPGDFRKHLMEAAKLLDAAGWKVREETVEDAGCGFLCRTLTAIGLRSAATERVLRNDKGEVLSAEFLLLEPSFERIVLPYADNLRKLGIKASVRLVDSSQFKRREDTHDYDIIIDTFGQSLSPGNEQRDLWGSATADREGTRNTIGIKNPAIDKLIDKIVYAKDREELVAATRALDRVLLWNHYVVPQWHYPFERLASWDIFGRPEKLPSQDPTSFQSWWIDAAKQKAVAIARGQ